MNTKKLFVLTVVNTALSTLFALLSVSFHADVSLIALPLTLVFTAVLGYQSCIQLFSRGNVRAIPVFRELLQYQPYVLLTSFVLRRAGTTGTPEILDGVVVVLWIVVAVLTLIILHYLNPKTVYNFDPAWKTAFSSLPEVKRTGIRWISFEIISWIDALVQAVFMVLLLNIFIVQLYEIPSESMVPEFLIKDRVVVFKTASGPKFPLSDIGLPCLKKYKRGDIVVFRNPHYQSDRKSEVKTFVSQLVYMISLTSVNLNTDKDGNPKADPLVKRVTGVPGEQLMLQDGILYVRTKASDDFKPMTVDNDWAAWNLNNTKSSIRTDIQQFPVTQEQYDSMIECEKERNELDTNKLADDCRSLANRFASISSRFAGSGTVTSSADSLFTATDLFEYTMFVQNESVTAKLLSSTGGRQWFTSFMTDWIGKNTFTSGERSSVTGDTLVGGNIYDDANFRLDLMIKETLGKLIVRNAELLAAHVQPSQWNSDAELQEYMKKAQMLNNYVMLLDRRNMPVFPANTKEGKPQYIPSNCYFMMGDNRFNSLDMRHSYDEWITPITPYDSYSVTYYSDMKPQYVNRTMILGTTSFRFWPASRIGVTGHTGK